MISRKKMCAFSFVLLIMLACAEQEIPDICGLYEGTRTAKYDRSGTFLVDIMRCDEDGIAGETEFISNDSYTVKSFEGDWQDDGDAVNIVFTETAVLDYYGGSIDKNKYYYKGTIVNGTLNADYYQNDIFVGKISLTRVDAKVRK